MKSKQTCFTLAALSGAVVLLAGGWWTLPEKAPVFNDVTSIVFTGEPWTGEALKLEITNPEDVAAFVGAIQLEKKDPCKCGEHWLTVAFKGTKREIKASICNHCFDVREPSKVRYYAMPKAFYEEFKKRIPEQRRAELHL